MGTTQKQAAILNGALSLLAALLCCGCGEAGKAQGDTGDAATVDTGDGAASATSSTSTDSGTTAGTDVNTGEETDTGTGASADTGTVAESVCGNGQREAGEKCDTQIDCGIIAKTDYKPGTMAKCSDDCKTIDDSVCEILPGVNYGTMSANFEYKYIYYREGDSRYKDGFLGNGRKYHEKYATYDDYLSDFPEGMNLGEIGTTTPFFTATFGPSEVLPPAGARSFRSYATFIDTDTLDHANALKGFERHVDVWQFFLDEDGEILREKAVLFEISTYAEFGPKYHRFGVSKDRDLNAHRLYIVDLDDSGDLDADAIKCVHAVVKPGQSANYKAIKNITDDLTGRIVGLDSGYTFQLQHPSTIDGWPADLPPCTTEVVDPAQ